MLKDLDFRQYSHIFLITGHTDMRQGINSLSAMVKYQLHIDPLMEGSLFLFCGRKRDRIKALCHESDGMILLYKRLFHGRYHWPMSEEDVKKLTENEFRQLMAGFSIESTIRDGTPKWSI